MSTGRRLHPALGTLVLLAAHFAASVLLFLAFFIVGGEELLNEPSLMAEHLAPLLAAPWLIAIPFYLTFGAWIAGLSFDSMGLKRPRHWNWLGAGLVDGVLLVLIPAGIALLLGGYSLLDAEATGKIEAATGLASIPSLLPLCAALLIAAFGEELLCRGLLLRYWQPVLGARGAIILSSVLFTAMHLGNENLSVFGILGLFLAGLLLGSVYVGS